MPSFIALAALHTLGRAGLGALLRSVTFLLAVLASVRIDSLLRAVTCTVTLLGTVDTLNGRGHGNVLRLLLLAMLSLC